jgi:hypothetical protein
MQREVHKYVELLIGIQLATDPYINTRRRLVFNFHLTIASRKLIRCCQQGLPSIEISCCSGLSSASLEGILKHTSSFKVISDRHRIPLA